ncbi:hypothetical protein GOBAR_DD33102 [Gossypium barbadense]|nr:hypothetical protein GOBAR_DD33102 [Gossypium barbadense]
MAEAFLSPLVDTMLDSLKSWSLKGLELAGSLKTEVASLENTLTTIQAVLQDAEEKQWKSEAIKNWLGKLKQAAYDPEVVLDDFNTEALSLSLHTDARSQGVGEAEIERNEDRQTSSLVKESEVPGRADEKEKTV